MAEVDAEEIFSHRERLESIAKKIVKDFQAAEDVASEAMMAACEAIQDGAVIANIGGWLTNVTQRRAAQWCREHLRKRQVKTMAVKEELAAIYQPSRELSVELTLILNRLHPTYRDAILRRYVDGADDVDSAREVGIERSTFRRRIQIAIEQLRLLYRAEFGDEPE